MGVGGAAYAQEQIRIWQAGEDTRLSTSEILFSDGGANFTVGEKAFDASTVDSITVVHTVTVTYSGDQATVDLGHAPKVKATVEGAHVSILSTN